MDHENFTQLLRHFVESDTWENEKLAKSLNVSLEVLLDISKFLSNLGVLIETPTNSTTKMLRNFLPYSTNDLHAGLETNILSNSQLYLFVSINSTNTYLKEQELSKPLLLCITEHQSQGRGRRGKDWCSPMVGNIYFSARRRVKISSQEIGCVSLIVGLAIIKALTLEGFTDLSIKWPNDIYQDGKKLAGVLIEVVSMNAEVSDIIIGIGLNIRTSQKYQKEINQPWANLTSAKPSADINRSTLLAKIINHIIGDLDELEKSTSENLLLTWPKYDYLLNRNVLVHQHNSTQYGICRGINEIGELLVESDGAIIAVNAGEVSVRTQGPSK